MLSKRDRIGPYRILSRLDEGGMGAVYLAESEGAAGVNKRVVVKTLLVSGSEAHTRLLEREARALARLRHPNVVQVIDLGEDDGERYLVMEHLDGLSLRAAARAAWAGGRHLPLDVVLLCVADACLGLHHAHALTDARGRPTPVIHRDISPDNLMACSDGVTRVVDFGVAKPLHADEDVTHSAVLRGKLSFMSPEQLQSEELDGRSDLFSLGVSLYWLLTGRTPFRGKNPPETIRNVLARDPTPPRQHNPWVPETLQRLVLQLLEKDPDDRPDDAGDVHDALHMLLRDERTSRAVVNFVASVRRLRAVDVTVQDAELAACKPEPWPLEEPARTDEEEEEVVTVPTIASPARGHAPRDSGETTTAIEDVHSLQTVIQPRPEAPATREVTEPSPRHMTVELAPTVVAPDPEAPAARRRSRAALSIVTAVAFAAGLVALWLALR